MNRKAYLDCVRVFSMIVVLLYHFGCEIWVLQGSERFFYEYANGSVGSIGVALFFMVSGCALFGKYKEKLNVKEFYKNRLLKIMLPFWGLYIFFFLWNFIEYKEFPNLPLYKGFLTLIGFDGFFSYKTQTFYLIGEWFLGSIIFLYVVFPLLNAFVKKNVRVVMGVLLLGFCLLSLGVFDGVFVIQNEMNLIVGMFYFVFGYWLEGVLLKIKPKIIVLKPKRRVLGRIRVVGIVGFLLAVVGGVCLLEKLPLPSLLCNLLIVGAIFTVAFCLDELAVKLEGKKVFNWLVENAYIIYLVHHILLIKLVVWFADRPYSLKGFVVIFLVWVVSIVVCVMSYHAIRKKFKETFV